MLDNDDNMPEWTQKKITKSADYVDTAADYISSQKERGVMEGDSEPNPVARAILHRIMMQHTGLLAAHGPEQVMDAVDEVADYIGDVEEIGTSDVSGWVREVERALSEQGVAEGSLDDIEDTKQFRDAVALAKTQKAIRQAKYGKDTKFYADGTPATPKEVARRAAERKARQQGVSEGGFNDDGSYNTSDDEATDFDEYDFDDTELGEAEYQGRKVKLGKPMQGDVAKSKVYVKDPKTGNVKKVNFGDPNMKIKKSNPARRKSFRARHNCDNPGPRTKARYWSCRAW
jgi:hypothetical protein